MPRLLIIEKEIFHCKDCYLYSRNPCSGAHNCNNNNIERSIINPSCIPDWCTLPKSKD